MKHNLSPLVEINCFETMVLGSTVASAKHLSTISSKILLFTLEKLYYKYIMNTTRPLFTTELVVQLLDLILGSVKVAGSTSSHIFFLFIFPWSFFYQNEPIQKNILRQRSIVTFGCEQIMMTEGCHIYCGYGLTRSF